MATEQEILAEVEELGRMTPEQEDILYAISLRQDELGRQQTNKFYKDVVGSPIYQPLIDRELLTFETYNHGATNDHAVVNLIVTLKGTRYCIMFSDEINERLKDFDIKVLVGCAPCQPFSTHRKDKKHRERHKDWGLLAQFGRLAEEVMPDYISITCPSS